MPPKSPRKMPVRKRKLRLHEKFNPSVHIERRIRPPQTMLRHASDHGVFFALGKQRQAKVERNNTRIPWGKLLINPKTGTSTRQVTFRSTRGVEHDYTKSWQSRMTRRSKKRPKS